MRAAAFTVITHQERYGTQRGSEPDPEIALECGRQKNVLIAADPDFEHLYAAEVRQAKIAVFYLTNNHDGPEKWGARILSAKDEIMEQLGIRRKPFVAHITVEGHINQVKLLYRKKIKTIKLRRKKEKPPEDGSLV